jgi:hypothetical protein
MPHAPSSNHNLIEAAQHAVTEDFPERYFWPGTALLWSFFYASPQPTKVVAHCDSKKGYLFGTKQA